MPSWAEAEAPNRPNETRTASGDNNPVVISSYVPWIPSQWIVAAGSSIWVFDAGIGLCLHWVLFDSTCDQLRQIEYTSQTKLDFEQLTDLIVLPESCIFYPAPHSVGLSCRVALWRSHISVVIRSSLLNLKMSNFRLGKNCRFQKCFGIPFPVLFCSRPWWEQTRQFLLKFTLSVAQIFQNQCLSSGN